MDLIIENVRCFSGQHRIPFSPLTFITGENSSGKSTLLAALSSIARDQSFPLQPDFDTDPYSLGPYDGIATFKGGRYGRANSFKIGYSDESEGHKREVVAKYIRKNNGLHGVDEITSSSGSRRLTLKSKDTKFEVKLYDKYKFKKPGLSWSFEAGQMVRDSGSDLLSGGYSLGNLLFSTFHSTAKADAERHLDYFALIHELAIDTVRNIPSMLSIAPIRTRPNRTYDRASQGFLPTGDHIPYLLSELVQAAATNESAKKQLNSIVQYGVDSGLFSDVQVNFLSRSNSGPFQITVRIGGKPFNLTDVGYGVSQSLPLIVQSVLGSKEEWLLVQQPEVHLHPRAQAAIGGFFARLAASGKCFVVETHSDYIIDRVRQEVARGVIPASSVSIIYLSRNKYDTTPHVISMDDHGNLENTPPGYREFFLREQMALLERNDDRNATRKHR